MNSPLTHIPRLLQGIRVRQKSVWIGAALLSALALVAVLLLVAVGVEAVLWLAPEPRGTVLGLTLGMAGLLLMVALVFALVTALRRQHPSDATLAHAVWDRDEDRRDRILDALDLARDTDPQASEALRLAALQQADRLAEGVRPQRYVDTTVWTRAWRGALVVLGVVVFTLSTGRGVLLDGAYRLAHPGQAFIPPGTVFLALDGPDSTRIVQGDTLHVAVRASHARPRAVELRIDEGAGSERVLPLTPNLRDTMLFTAAVPGLRRDARIHARAGSRAFSDTMTVDVITRPRIARLNVTVSPPRYTGLDPVRLPEGVGDLTALPGSRISLEMRASRELADASILVARGSSPVSEASRIDTVDVSQDEAAVNGSFLLRRPGRWWVEFTAADGVGSGEPLIWSLATAEDLPPRLEIHSPEDGALIPESLQLPLAVTADDDYGISRMRLRYRVYSSMMGPDSVGEDQFGGFDLPIESPAPGQALAAVRWSLENLPLLPTDEVQWFVEVWDNDQWAGPKRVRSELRRLVFPSVEELYAMTEESETNVGEELAKAREQAEATRQKLEETLTRLRSNPEDLSWDEAKAVQQALDDQEQALEQMQKVAESLEQMRQTAQDHQLMSEELLEKYKRLQELIAEVQSPEMQEAMEKLREAMENLDGEQMREALEEMMQDQDALMENLDRNLAILEQLKAERKLDELATRAEDLADRQEAISEQLETADPQEMQRLAEEQRSIEEDAQSLAEQMEQAAEELSETHPQSADSLSAQSGEMQDPSFQEPMESAEQAMQQGNRQESSQKSQEAAEKMRSMAMRMRQNQQQMVQQNQQQLAAEMNRVFSSILVLSHWQEELRERSRSLGVASPRYRELAGDQEAIITGMAAADREVQALMRKTFFVGAAVAGNLARARAQMQEAIRRYTDRRPREVTTAQTDALAFLHRSLKQLNQSQQQMQGSGSGTGYQEMMQQLEQMAQQQQGINNQSGQMPMPMPGVNPGGSSLQQLAAQQRAMAEQMAQMERQAQSMEEILGSLDGLSKDMQDVADDLEDRNVTDRTKRLQQRILQRLLDSQRSLQERDRSQRRQGQVADDLPRSSPGDLPVETEDELRQRLLRALEGDYSQAWKETIREYFRALERDRRQAPPEDSSSPSSSTTSPTPN